MSTLFEDALSLSWGPDTSSDPTRWNGDIRAWRQDEATVLLVNDLFGGTIWRGTVRGVPHYFNTTADGMTRDYTVAQFGPDPFRMDHKREAVTRETLLAMPEVEGRYLILKARLTEKLTALLMVG